MIKLIHGDSNIELDKLEENSVDTIVTDPPYELGFMGKKWDSTGIAYDVNFWKKCLRVLKPGGYLLAFGGSRTIHRITCAIEDAGFEIRDGLMWVYGSGFPKAHDISKAIDKMKGKKGTLTASDGSELVNRKVFGGEIFKLTGTIPKNRQTSNPMHYNAVDSKAKLWKGRKTALKPAYEPIIIAMKPIDGTFANNALKWGVAGLNIDECRVEIDDKDPNHRPNQTYSTKHETHGAYNVPYHPGTIRNPRILESKGRFPANLILDNSEEVEKCFPEGAKAWSKATNGTKKGKESMFGIGGVNANRYDMGGQSTSRYFQHCDYGELDRIFYCPKVSSKERNAGLDGFEEKKCQSGIGGAMPIDDKGIARDRFKTTQYNTHPTLKPIALMRYLVRLTKTPTGGVVLDPFMGSGTTGIACIFEDRDFIGIEREQEYIDIADARCKHAQQLKESNLAF